jgi:ubiquinol-cytochrome c reductase iron-sulfur subunit
MRNDQNPDQFDLVREGARRDGVEIAVYKPHFPAGSGAERRAERRVAGFLALSTISALAALAVYLFWPWEYQQGPLFDEIASFSDWNLSKLYTPFLGLTMALALFGFGGAIVSWAKNVLPEEVSIQERHDGGSAEDEKSFTAATLSNMLSETQITRRPLLKRALLGALLPLGGVLTIPIIGGLVKDPHKGEPLLRTGFRKGVRLILEDGTPVRPEHVSAGGFLTVFPDIPGGTTNRYASSPTLLFHLRPADAAHAKGSAKTPDGNWGPYYAYSKICTHAGCPPSLYEQQTHRLLCPCHQSQFDVVDGCRPIFGPAARPLPQLPITVDSEGYFVATSDYREPVGPSFWERA